MHGCTYSIIPDQIEAGSYMVAATITGGNVLIKNVIPKHLEPITSKLEKAGATIEEFDDSLRVYRTGDLEPLNIKTMPHPGFPTDMQPLMTVLLTLAKGTSIITEGIWENRFRYVDELTRMGANIQVDGRVAVIEGVQELLPAPMRAADLRAGAALVVAALAADGVSEVDEIDLVRFRLALTQRARGNNDILAFQAGGLFKHGPVRGIVKNKLQDACGVPQVRKNNAALVAAFCDGAGHRHLCARVPGAQRPAIVGTAQVSHCFHKNHPFRRFASAQIQEQTPAPRHAKQNWRGIRQRPRDTTAQRPLSITV